MAAAIPTEGPVPMDLEGASLPEAADTHADSQLDADQSPTADVESPVQQAPPPKRKEKG